MKGKWINSSNTPTYFAWRNMRRRCSSPADHSWQHYGLRGIRVCPEWESYDQFVADMGLKPDGMTLERLDTNGNYEPDNCAWVTLRDNLNNRRNTIKANGIPVSVLAEQTGIKAATLVARVRRYKTNPERILLPRLNAPQPAEHGTRRRYERDGCRCDTCKAGNAERARGFRRQQREAKRAQLVVNRLGGVEQ